MLDDGEKFYRVSRRHCWWPANQGDAGIDSNSQTSSPSCAPEFGEVWKQRGSPDGFARSHNAPVHLRAVGDHHFHRATVDTNLAERNVSL